MSDPNNMDKSPRRYNAPVSNTGRVITGSLHFVYVEQVRCDEQRGMDLHTRAQDFDEPYDRITPSYSSGMSALSHLNYADSQIGPKGMVHPDSQNHQRDVISYHPDLTPRPYFDELKEFMKDADSIEHMNKKKNDDYKNSQSNNQYLEYKKKVDEAVQEYRNFFEDIPYVNEETFHSLINPLEYTLKILTKTLENKGEKLVQENEKETKGFEDKSNAIIKKINEIQKETKEVEASTSDIKNKLSTYEPQASDADQYIRKHFHDLKCIVKTYLQIKKKDDQLIKEIIQNMLNVTRYKTVEVDLQNIEKLFKNAGHEKWIDQLRSQVVECYLHRQTSEHINQCIDEFKSANSEYSDLELEDCIYKAGQLSKYAINKEYYFRGDYSYENLDNLYGKDPNNGDNCPQEQENETQVDEHDDTVNSDDKGSESRSNSSKYSSDEENKVCRQDPHNCGDYSPEIKTNSINTHGGRSLDPTNEGFTRDQRNNTESIEKCLNTSGNSPQLQQQLHNLRPQNTSDGTPSFREYLNHWPQHLEHMENNNNMSGCNWCYHLMFERCLSSNCVYCKSLKQHMDMCKTFKPSKTTKIMTATLFKNRNQKCGLCKQLKSEDKKNKEEKKKEEKKNKEEQRVQKERKKTNSQHK